MRTSKYHNNSKENLEEKSCDSAPDYISRLNLIRMLKLPVTHDKMDRMNVEEEVNKNS